MENLDIDTNSRQETHKIMDVPLDLITRNPRLNHEVAL